MDSDTTGSALQGAGTGAVAGSAFGPWGAAIGAGVGLIGGLLGAKARKEAERKKREFEGTMMGLQTQATAGQAFTQGSQNAFSQLMQGYGGIAGGR